MSNPIRADILKLLRKGELTATEISDHFSLTGATISHHLSKLKQCDLISERKYKNYIYYRINTSVVEDMMSFLASYLGGNKDE